MVKSPIVLQLGRLGLVVMLTAWSAPQVSALTLSNREAVPHRITVIRGADRITHTIAPASVLTDICSNGCILKLEDGSEWVFDGSERASIEGMLVYYDGPERPAPTPKSETPRGDGSAPRAPIQR